MIYEIETTKSPEARFTGYSAGLKTLAAIAEAFELAEEEAPADEEQAGSNAQENGGSN